MVGPVPVGGAHPISVQTMLSRVTTGPDEDLEGKLRGLKNLGCDILRMAVPGMNALEDLKKVLAVSAMPLVADIHFDHRIAMAVMDLGIAKLRINPGNLGPEWKTREVLRKALDKNIPVRVGINGGSLPEEFKGMKDHALAMLQAAEQELEYMEKAGFTQAVFSLKSSDIETTCRANRLFAERYDFPLHLGVTEAGPLIEGVVKSSIAFTRLLASDIGSTLRVSLTDTEENEVIAGRAILTSLGLSEGTTIISCPRCGRSTFDTHEFIRNYGDVIRSCGKNITVAVMGCRVNGPDEAASADLGITGSGSRAVIFKHGKILASCRAEQAGEVFLKELENL